MRPGLVVTLIALLAVLAACATRSEREVVVDQATKDDILTAVFTDYIAFMPPEATAKGRKAFYVTAGREEVSPTVIRRLQRRWPSIISRSTFDQRYGNMDASWGYYGAEIKKYSPSRAVVYTWSSRPYDTARKYELVRRKEVWTVASSELYSAPLNLKPPRPKRPTPSPTPVRPFYP